MMYVLVFVATVNGGNIMHTQEFLTKERCEAARDYVLARKTFFNVQVECFQK
jgi:hypothetical protein